MIIVNISHSEIKLEKNKPNEIKHKKFRTWQINQPFISNNNISKIDLQERQKNKIINYPYILQIYSNLINIYNKKYKL